MTHHDPTSARLREEFQGGGPLLALAAALALALTAVMALL